ncbi:MAG: hypothetical protein KGI73_03570, partial [Patescibacteria group bacterium]|nr:hypothetical protein [Patescibacteria group bacterium]
VKTLLQKHISEVESGIKSEIKPGQVNINDNIQLELNLYFKDFFIRGGIALSYLVKFASFLGYNISFIYQKDRDFETGIKKFLEKHNSPLMEFLVDRVRTERVHWYTTFRKTRNDIEHEGWNLPNIKYSLENGQIKVLVPKFTDTLSINEGVDFLWIKLMEFCEEMVVMLISTKLPPHFAIVHLPKEKRDLKNPVRYQVVLALNGLPQI